jgi:hypothetical protein
LLEPTLGATRELQAAAAPGFSAGQVIGRSFSVWFGNFVPFSFVALAVFLPEILFVVVMPDQGSAGWNVLDRLVSMLCGVIAEGAIAFGVLRALRGERTGIGALLERGLGKSRKVLGVSLVVAIIEVVGTVLLIVPGLMAACAFFVAVPAIVIETGADTDSAMKRSRVLTKGNRWAILAVLAVVVAVRLAVGGAADVGAGLVEDLLPHPVPAVLVSVVIALTVPLGAAAAAVAYHDLRVTQEGISTADLVRIFE